MKPTSPPRCCVWSAAILATAILTVALAAVNVWFGPLNHDEGWYLLAAQNVARGMRPYRDFLYTQGPALPLVYGALSPLWSHFGVLGGRVLTALFGFLATLCFAASAGNIVSAHCPAARRPAIFFTLALLGLSPDWSYFTVIPKTYAFASCCLGLAVFLLTSPLPRRSPFFSGIFFAFAAATRATASLAAVPFFVLLAARAFRGNNRRAWRSVFAFAIGGALAATALYAPVLALARDNFVFSQTYHTARASAPLADWIILRGAFLCFLAQGYPSIVAAVALSLAFVPCGIRSFKQLRGWGSLVAVAGAFVLISAAHFLVPFPYADYNTPAMPFAAVLGGVALARGLAHLQLRHAFVAVATLGASVAFLAASPWPMKWIGGHQDRFWFSTDARTALSRLREAGRIVREANSNARPILAQDAYIAVEAGIPVVPGLEMGPFSIFPDLDDETARLRKVHNITTLTEAIQNSGADVAVLGGYTFALECPSTKPLDGEAREKLLALVRESFPDVLATYARFGQQNTPLEIRRSPARQ